jgi:hypothetical protein
MAATQGRCQRFVVLSLLLALAPVAAAAQSNDVIRALAQREKQPHAPDVVREALVLLSVFGADVMARERRARGLMAWVMATRAFHS